MTVEEFTEKYNGAPFSLDELAGTIIGESVPEFDQKANSYLKARDALLIMLDEAGYEFG